MGTALPCRSTNAIKSEISSPEAILKFDSMAQRGSAFLTLHPHCAILVDSDEHTLVKFPLEHSERAWGLNILFTYSLKNSRNQKVNSDSLSTKSELSLAEGSVSAPILPISVQDHKGRFATFFRRP
jgi:hypothetical protein